MSTSPPVTVTVAPADFDQPVATPAIEPNTGGTTAITGNTSVPDGQVLHLFLGDTDTGLTATAAGGAYAFPTVPVAPNASMKERTDSFTVQF